MPDATSQKLRADARAVFDAALEAADPKISIRNAVRIEGRTLRVGEGTYDLDAFSRVLVVGAGKASAQMASAVEEVLGDRVSGGLINTKYDHGVPLRRVEVNECGHPVPDEAGVAGTERIVRMLAEADERTLVFCLLSGGGSALMPAPADGITFAEKQETTRQLLACGATINELNAVRKHLSKVKGGQLARIAFPATLVSLVLSDVIGDPLDVIASGPTAPDESTFGHCLEILRKYEVQDRIPKGVMERLQGGSEGKVQETPKPGDSVLSRCRNLIVGSNRLAVAAAREKAEALGYRTLMLSTRVQGEAREVAKVFAAIGKEIRTTGAPIPTPACVICGGETTVTLRGKGKGGRNQEIALSAAMEIEGWSGLVIFSGGTDGTDGPTDAAGAVADGETVARARGMGLAAGDFLKENDSYPYFERLGDLVMTGPTGTNVMDVALIMVG
ncbi:MAG: glycerate kinase [Candidatus Latescibacteria bacterium]|nr:glycerate kinase [Candidatus Latescibacterota bacterium]